MIHVISTRPVLVEYYKIVKGEIPSLVISPKGLIGHLKPYLHWVLDQEDEDSYLVRDIFEEFQFLDISFTEADRIFNQMGMWLNAHIQKNTGCRPHDFKSNWRIRNVTRSLFLSDNHYT